MDPGDFRQLRSRMLSTALAFADLDGKVCNNTSVVLLIEWKGKRLLFVGDAEWDAAFKEGKGNCSWNVMWNLRKERIKGPLAFYKIGHHGSVNATPWGMTPAASKGRATRHSRCDPATEVESKGKGDRFDASRELPDDPAHRSPRRDRDAGVQYQELRRRVQKAGKKTSDVPLFDDKEKKSFAKPQPLRTDLERMLVDSHRLRRRRNRSVIADNGPFYASETAACALAIRDSVIPRRSISKTPTRNAITLRWSRKRKRSAPRSNNSLGFGGHSTTFVLVHVLNRPGIRVRSPLD